MQDAIKFHKDEKLFVSCFPFLFDTHFLLVICIILAPQMIAFQYGNVTEGIPDRKVFDVPSYCMSPAKSADIAAKPKRVCAPETFQAFAYIKLAQVVQGKPVVLPGQIFHGRDMKSRLEFVESGVEYEGKLVRTRVVIDWNKVSFCDNYTNVLVFQENLIKYCTVSAQLRAVSSKQQQ